MSLLRRLPLRPVGAGRRISAVCGPCATLWELSRTIMTAGRCSLRTANLLLTVKDTASAQLNFDYQWEGSIDHVLCRARRGTQYHSISGIRGFPLAVPPFPDILVTHWITQPSNGHSCTVNPITDSSQQLSVSQHWSARQMTGKLLADIQMSKVFSSIHASTKRSVKNGMFVGQIVRFAVSELAKRKLSKMIHNPCSQVKMSIWLQHRCPFRGEASFPSAWGCIPSQRRKCIRENCDPWDWKMAVGRRCGCQDMVANCPWLNVRNMVITT